MRLTVLGAAKRGAGPARPVDDAHRLREHRRPLAALDLDGHLARDADAGCESPASALTRGVHLPSLLRTSCSRSRPTAGSSRGHAEVAGPVIATASLARAPRRSRIVSRRPARRQARIHGIADVHDRAARRTRHRAPSGRSSVHASASRCRSEPAYPSLGMGRAARARDPGGWDASRPCIAREMPSRAHRAAAGDRRASGGLPGAVAGPATARACRSSWSASSGSSCGAGCTRPAWRAARASTGAGPERR